MMSFRLYCHEAIRQLFASKLRALLAVLGILVGTAAVVAMISIGELAEQQILDQFEAMGTNLLSVSIVSSNYGQTDTMDGLSLPAAKQVVTASPNITAVAPYVLNYGNIRFAGHSLQGSAVGITSAMFDIAKLKLASGRYLSFLDANHYYAMIGHTLAVKIRHKTGLTNLIGTQVTVGNNIYTIVGTLQKWPSNFFFQTDFNSAVLIPITTALNSLKNAAIANLAVRIQDINQITTTSQALTRYINAHSDQQRVQVESPQTLINSMEQSSHTMTLLLGFIGSISLIVGGIGVMNIMLVSVTERRREIGIRMAVGARQKDIQRQFLMEAVALSVFGGIMGMIIGILVTIGVSIYSNWHFTFFIGPPLIGCLVSVLIGVFFGYYPARKASKLDPIQTLRSH